MWMQANLLGVLPCSAFQIGVHLHSSCIDHSQVAFWNRHERFLVPYVRSIRPREEGRNKRKQADSSVTAYHLVGLLPSVIHMGIN
jgi:hypothetical protein